MILHLQSPIVRVRQFEIDSIFLLSLYNRSLPSCATLPCLWGEPSPSQPAERSSPPPPPRKCTRAATTSPPTLPHPPHPPPALLCLRRTQHDLHRASLLPAPAPTRHPATPLRLPPPPSPSPPPLTPALHLRFNDSSWLLRIPAASLVCAGMRHGGTARSRGRRRRYRRQRS